MKLGADICVNIRGVFVYIIKKKILRTLLFIASSVSIRTVIFPAPFRLGKIMCSLRLIWLVAEKLLALRRKNIVTFIKNHPAAERQRKNKFIYFVCACRSIGYLPAGRQGATAFYVYRLHSQDCSILSILCRFFNRR